MQIVNSTIAITPAEPGPAAIFVGTFTPAGATLH
jgi:hypothetical protein